MTYLLKKSPFLFLVVLLGCATMVEESATIAPGKKPEKASLEAGLWKQVEKIETETRRSGRLIKDPELNNYIKNIVCDLAGEHCPDIRVYILDVNLFNAAMYPNGMMHLYTGLLLRVQNEAQLASVLGHEIVHFVQRHSLKRYIDIQTKADAMAIINIPLGLLGPYASLASLAGQLAMLGSIMAYSRDHEREADVEGLKLLAHSGYATEQAPIIWKNIKREHDVDEEGSGLLFFASHPFPEERIENLENLSKKISIQGTPKTGKENFESAVKSFRGKWFDDELLRNKYSQTRIVLSQLSPSKLYPGELEFFRGELVRMEKEDNFVMQSIEHYQKAIDLDPQDPRARREIGLMLMKTDQKARAAENLRAYLELEPGAADASVIKTFLKQIR